MDELSLAPYVLSLSNRNSGAKGNPLRRRTRLPDAVPQFVAIRTASLDDPSWFKPQMDVWTCDAHPWDEMNPALAKLEKYPQ